MPRTSHGLYWSRGNVKVKVPVFSFCAALDCPSRFWCPHDAANYRAAGVRKCYAQSTETRFSAALAARQENALAISAAVENGPAHIGAAADELADAMVARAKRADVRYIRLSESGDVDAFSLPFALALIWRIRQSGIAPYIYTRAHGLERQSHIPGALQDAGAVVLESGEDFVYVRDRKAARAIGLPVCPARGCGTTCTRCPRGLQTAVIGH